MLLRGLVNLPVVTERRWERAGGGGAGAGRAPSARSHRRSPALRQRLPALSSRISSACSERELGRPHGVPPRLAVPLPTGAHSALSAKGSTRGRAGRTSPRAPGSPAHRPASAGGSALGPPRCSGSACLHQCAFCSPLALDQQNTALPGESEWFFIFITRDIPCVTHTYTTRAHALTNGKARYEGLMLCCDTNNCCIA